MSRALQQKIHIGCRQLGMDGDARRGLQLAVTGKASMKDMTEAELTSVLKRLKNDGFKPATAGNHRHKKAPRADLRLVHVLWRLLGDAGELTEPSRDGLNKFIKSRFGTTWGFVPADVDMLCEPKAIDDVLQALMSWADRAEVDFDRRNMRS
ncbi:regulatory protein GemA [Phaeobacter inhibens]|nr:regulatory protein GemA [Phaeobacter inhibens]KXF92129.1 Rha family transcriptional regulator [Phaeobacter inhibens]WHP70420.1 regulatory protein GemA [Phaeobacter inhibens]